MVIAIELAGQAAVGSFRSSLETLLGKTDLQITANGGVDETWVARLAALPRNMRVSPVIETQAIVEGAGPVPIVRRRPARARGPRRSRARWPAGSVYDAAASWRCRSTTSGSEFDDRQHRGRERFGIRLARHRRRSESARLLRQAGPHRHLRLAARRFRPRSNRKSARCSPRRIRSTNPACAEKRTSACCALSAGICGC